MRVALPIFFLSALLAGCDLHWAPEDGPRTDIALGRALFETDCAACHGANGGGDGPELATGVRAPDLRQLSAMNDGVFPRNRVMSTIDGFNRGTHWENPMPEFGEIGLGAMVQVEEDGISTPIPANLLALATYLESIQD